MPRYPSGDSPRFPDDPRKFFRVATQRFAEAQFLFNGDRYTASIYIAGYSVECGLKALILSTEPRNRQAELAASFRGSEWHNLNWLVEGYIKRGGPRPSRVITADLTYVHDEWSVDLRYIAGEKPFREAERFILSIERILEWVKGRL
jgi:hypothetical protein